MRLTIKWSAEADEVILGLWNQPGERKASGQNIADLVNAAGLCTPPATRQAVLCRLYRLRKKLGDQAVPRRPDDVHPNFRRPRGRRKS